MKTSVFVGISLDGFLARPNHDLDWLTGSNGGGGDHGFGKFFKSVDCLVMGRNTFDKVLSFKKWFYGKKPVVVLTSRPIKIPPRLSTTVEAMKGTPVQIMKRLSARGFKHLYVDGGITIQRFLREGLIDELTLSALPVLIGEGIPLFRPTPRDIKLNHLYTRTFPGGMVQSKYSIHRKKSKM